MDIIFSFWVWWSLKLGISNKLQGNAAAAGGPTFSGTSLLIILPSPATEAQAPSLGQPSPREELVSRKDAIGRGQGDGCKYVWRASFSLPGVSRTGGNEKYQSLSNTLFWALSNCFNLKNPPPVMGGEERLWLDSCQFPCLSKITVGLWRRQIRFCSPGMQTAASEINLRRLPW